MRSVCSYVILRKGVLPNTALLNRIMLRHPNSISETTSARNIVYSSESTQRLTRESLL